MKDLIILQTIRHTNRDFFVTSCRPASRMASAGPNACARAGVRLECPDRSIIWVGGADRHNTKPTRAGTLCGAGRRSRAGCWHRILPWDCSNPWPPACTGAGWLWPPRRGDSHGLSPSIPDRRRQSRRRRWPLDLIPQYNYRVMLRSARGQKPWDYLPPALSTYSSIAFDLWATGVVKYREYLTALTPDVLRGVYAGIDSTYPDRDFTWPEKTR